MIHAFCDKKGSGKTKALINLANEKVQAAKGDIVFIDSNKKPLLQLERRIRLISTDEFNLKTYSDFYGFLCGILSEDYDIDTIFIDGLFDIVGEQDEDAAHLFYAIESLSQKYNLEVYMNVNSDSGIMPEFVRKYVA